MAAIIEKVESREATVSADSPAVDLVYAVTGTEDDAAVKSLVEATAPAVYAGLVLQSYTIAPAGGGLWDVSVRYGKVEPKETGDSVYNFDTGGGTAHVSQSLETIQGYAVPPASPPDFKGAIGVNGDTVEGTDVVTPAFNFSETHYLADATVTTAYKLVLFGLTGRVNNASWKGLAKGEALFLGASGSKRGSDDWEITFRFSASPNATGLEVGDITGIDKEGWHYLWVRYKDAEDENVLVKQPSSVYVERVYEYGDFSLLGIGI